MRNWKYWLFIYLVLLLISHGWRLVDDHIPQSHPEGYDSVTVSIASQAQVKDTARVQADVYYRDIYKGDEADPPVALLLQDSPTGVSTLDPLIQELSSQVRVIAPEFPARQSNGRPLPDYSMRSYAEWFASFLDEMDIEQAHLVGFSLGGGVAANLSHHHTERVESIVMLSAIGVQELVLLGSYNLNKAVYGGQLGIAWLLGNTVPHFGMMDDNGFNVAYARIYYDSDLRPHREYLKEFHKPMLIQHGRDDGIVPPAAAREHHRIVPHSILRMYEGGYDLAEEKPRTLAMDIVTFLEEVEQGEAPLQEDAAEERLAAAERSFDEVGSSRAQGKTLLLLMLIIVVSTLLSEDLTFIAAGLMAARGIIDFWSAIGACFAGIMIGDFGIFLIGRWLGRPVLQKAPFKWLISEADIKRSADWFKAKGPAIIIASRFIPGSRFPTYFTAGVIGAGFWMFAVYFITGSLIWTPALVGGAMLLGTELLWLFSAYQGYVLWMFLLVLFVILLFTKVVIPLFSYSGRRKLKGRWIRLTHFGYWPAWILYLPVLGYAVFLCIKYRKLLLFSAANPAFTEKGGFVISRKEALDLFSESGRVVPSEVFSADRSTQQVFIEIEEFMSRAGINYPVLLRPDGWGRDKDGGVASSAEELKEKLKEFDQTILVQPFLGRELYDLFYTRDPETGECTIEYISGKWIPNVVGDGNKTLEELILSNEETLVFAKLYLENFRRDLYRIPGKGEKIHLADTAQLSRGALVKDASRLLTPELRRCIHRITEGAGQINMGRLTFAMTGMDTYAGNEKKEGDAVRITEFQGVWARLTPIYNADTDFKTGFKMLFRWWKNAFALGEYHRQKGVHPKGFFELLKTLKKEEF